jgi:hypothetical protein
MKKEKQIKRYKKIIHSQEKKISLFDIDGLELQKMFYEFDMAMEHRKNDPAITHSHLRLVSC